jgi:hypothetical protein
MNAEQLAAEIARETGVKLSTADPVLATATINEILLDKALAKFDRLVKAHFPTPLSKRCRHSLGRICVGPD